MCTERAKLRTFWMRSGAEMAPSTRSIRFFSSCMSACLWSWRADKCDRYRARTSSAGSSLVSADMPTAVLPSALCPVWRCLRASARLDTPENTQNVDSTAEPGHIQAIKNTAAHCGWVQKKKKKNLIFHFTSISIWIFGYRFGYLYFTLYGLFLRMSEALIRLISMTGVLTQRDPATRETATCRKLLSAEDTDKSQDKCLAAFWI